MDATAEAPALNEENLAAGQQPGRGLNDSAGKANRKVESVIEPAPREGTVRLDQIEIDGALQSREGLDEATISEYQRVASEAMEDGQPWPFPAVQLIGSRLVDGFHRAEVAKRLGLREIPAVDRPGSSDDAVRAAIGANANHGLRRSREDVRRAINMAQQQWPDLSAREIARRVQCSPQTVLNARSRDTQSTPDEVSKLDTQPTEFVRALEQLKLGDRLLQGQNPAEDWTLIERLSEGFRVLRLIGDESLEIDVQTAGQVDRVLRATDESYSMAVAIEPFAAVVAA